MPDNPEKVCLLWKGGGRRRLARPVLLAGFWLMLLPLSLAVSALDVASAIPDAQRPSHNTTRIVLAWDNAGHAVLTVDLGAPRQADGQALLLPIPGEIETREIEAGDLAVLERLDAITAPRLTEISETDPCARPPRTVPLPPLGKETPLVHQTTNISGGYDVRILAPARSEDIEKLLSDSHYYLSPAVRTILASYLKQKMQFILVRIAEKPTGTRPPTRIQPLKISYKTQNFMLPIRLGDTQDLNDILLFTLTRHGRVEPANYITTKLKIDVELPLFVRHDFPGFYQAMFDRANRGDAPHSVLLEYAGGGEDCPSCPVPSLNASDLRGLGAIWGTPDGRSTPNVYITRLHARFDPAYFPEDLILNETRDREGFVARYRVPSPPSAHAKCPAGEDYQENLANRARRQAQDLQRLTGWPADDIMTRMGHRGQLLRNDWPDTESDPLFYQFLYGGR